MLLPAQEELALLEQQLLVEEKRQREARKKRKERYRHEYIQVCICMHYCGTWMAGWFSGMELIGACSTGGALCRAQIMRQWTPCLRGLSSSNRGKGTKKSRICIIASSRSSWKPRKHGKSNAWVWGCVISTSRHEKVFPPEEKKGLNLMPELTQEELALYQEKMWNGHDEEIVISLFSVDLMREKLQCLANG